MFDGSHITDDTISPRWITKLGFRFDPFAYLEASEDPHLGSYLIGHELFAVARDEEPGLIFAPAGGGKTATRIYVARSCWAGRGGSNPFPIPYQPGTECLTAAEHQQALAHTGVRALMIALLHRPELFLRLQPAQRRDVTALLDHALPVPLDYYIELLRSDEPYQQVAGLLERSYILPLLHEQPNIEALCDALEQEREPFSSLNGKNLLDALFTILLDTFRFRSVLVQIDGVDASPTSVDKPQLMADIVDWPLAQSADWARRRIFIKGFLPSELEPVLRDRLGSLEAFRTVQLKWTRPLLAEVIRQRVWHASGERIGSLDAVSSPLLRDVERQLAGRLTLPLPREIIVLTQKMLEAYDERTGTVTGDIEPGDIAAAQQWYTTHQIDPGALMD